MPTGPALIVRLGVSGLTTVQAAFGKLQASANSMAAGIARAATSTAGMLAGAAGVAGVAAGLKEALDMGGRLSDMAARTGIATKALVVLEQAFKDSGLAAEKVGTSIAKMQDNLVSAARGDAGPARAFESMRLSAAELLALEPDEQMAAIGKAIAGMEDPAKRTAAAIDVFGKSGAELITLFRDSTVFDVAAQRVGRLAEVMGRRAGLFDAISDAFGGLRVKTLAFFAGLADLVAPELERVANAINAIDLTAAGQKVGAFVSLTIAEWQRGRLGELIALTIEAGFEAGSIAARRVWSELMDWIGSPNFWAQLALGLASFATQTTQAVTEALSAALQPVAGALTWFLDRWRFGVETVWETFKVLGAGAINWLAARLEAVLAAARAATASIPGVGALVPKVASLGRVEAVAGDVRQPMTMAEAMAGVAEAKASMTAATREFFQGGNDAARALLGAGFKEEGAALEELNRRINEMVAERTQAEEAASRVIRSQVQQGTTKVQLAEIERAAKTKLLEIEGRRARIDGDFGTTAAEKWQLRRAALEEERRTLEGIVATLREKAALEQDSAARETLLSRADSFDRQIAGTDRSLSGMGPNPYSTPEQIQSAITGLEDQFGTTAQAIARSFTSVIGSAVDSVAQGIEGLIMGTMTWADALRNVARTMLTSVVQAISRMFAEWIAKRALAAVKNMMFSTQEGATDTAAKAPGALMSSISSYGIAAAVGLAALIAAMAAIGGGFREGGYTGAGAPDQVAGVVHRGEYVIPAPAVAQIGIENLDAMRSGVVPASQSPAGVPNVGKHTVQIAAFDTRLDAQRWANSQEGQTWFVDMARKTAHRWAPAA